MVERRSFPRLGKRLIAEFTSEHFAGTGFTRDVSHTGLFVASARLPLIGASLSLLLSLDNGKKVRVEGTVVRKRRAPASLAFSEPTGFSIQLRDYSEELTRYLSSLDR